MLNFLAALVPAASSKSGLDDEDFPLRLMGGELADDGKLIPAGKSNLGAGRFGG